MCHEAPHFALQARRQCTHCAFSVRITRSLLIVMLCLKHKIPDKLHSISRQRDRAKSGRCRCGRTASAVGVRAIRWRNPDGNHPDMRSGTLACSQVRELALLPGG